MRTNTSDPAVDVRGFCCICTVRLPREDHVPASPFEWVDGRTIDRYCSRCDPHGDITIADVAALRSRDPNVLAEWQRKMHANVQRDRVWP